MTKKASHWADVGKRPTQRRRKLAIHSKRCPSDACQRLVGSAFGTWARVISATIVSDQSLRIWRLDVVLSNPTIQLEEQYLDTHTNASDNGTDLVLLPVSSLSFVPGLATSAHSS